MKPEPDFTKVTFKVNAAGSWANLLVGCPSDRIEEVKAACAVIGKGTRIKFRYLDADGETIEEYSYVVKFHHGNVWHTPMKQRRV